MGKSPLNSSRIFNALYPSIKACILLNMLKTVISTIYKIVLTGSQNDFHYPSHGATHKYFMNGCKGLSANFQQNVKIVGRAN